MTIFVDPAGNAQTEQQRSRLASAAERSVGIQSRADTAEKALGRRQFINRVSPNVTVAGAKDLAGRAVQGVGNVVKPIAAQALTPRSFANRAMAGLSMLNTANEARQGGEATQARWSQRFGGAFDPEAGDGALTTTGKILGQTIGGFAGDVASMLPDAILPQSLVDTQPNRVENFREQGLPALPEGTTPTSADDRRAHLPAGSANAVPVGSSDADGNIVTEAKAAPQKVSSLQKAMSAVDRQSDALSKSLASEGTTQAKSGLGAYGMGGGMDSQSFQDRVGLAMANKKLATEQASAKLAIDAAKAQYDMKKDSADRIGKFNLFTTTDGDGKVVEDLEANNQAKRAAMEAGIGGIVDPEQQQGAMVNAALHNQLTRNAASVDEKLRDTSGGLRLAKGPQGQGATFADYFQSGSDDIGVFDALLGRKTVRIEDGKGGTRAVTTKSLGKNAAGGQDPTTNAYLRALMAKSQQGV